MYQEGEKRKKTPTHLLETTTVSTILVIHICVWEYIYCNVYCFVTCILSLLYGDHLSVSLNIHYSTTALFDNIKNDTNSNMDCPSRNLSGGIGKTVAHSAKDSCPGTSEHLKF